MTGANSLFRSSAGPTSGGADVRVGAGSPYATTLGPSNTVQPVTGVVGHFRVPSSFNASWQQPVTPPPTPQPGVKSILSEQPIQPAGARVVPLFSPAPDWSHQSL